MASWSSERGVRSDPDWSPKWRSQKSQFEQVTDKQPKCVTTGRTWYRSFQKRISHVLECFFSVLWGLKTLIVFLHDEAWLFCFWCMYLTHGTYFRDLQKSRWHSQKGHERTPQKPCTNKNIKKTQCCVTGTFGIRILQGTATRDWHFVLLSCGNVEQATLKLKLEAEEGEPGTSAFVVEESWSNVHDFVGASYCTALGQDDYLQLMVPKGNHMHWRYYFSSRYMCVYIYVRDRRIRQEGRFYWNESKSGTLGYLECCLHMDIYDFECSTDGASTVVGASFASVKRSTFWGKALTLCLLQLLGCHLMWSPLRPP